MKSLILPWAAWYGDFRKEFPFPETMEIQVCEPEKRPALSPAGMVEKLKPLFALLNEKKPRNPVIVVDDLTRPLKTENLFDILIEILGYAAIPDENITLLIGLGGHRPLSRADIGKKVGSKASEKYKIVNHDPFGDLVELPYSWRGTPVRLNSHFVEADFRIILSGLTPHSFAGFSGGAKMLFPGLADMEIVTRTHKSVMMGFMGKLGDVENNRFRSDIEALTARIGVDFFIGMVANTEREITNLFCGDIVNAHRQAAGFARDYYTMNINEDPFDIVVLNPYPKDTELLQLESAFIPLNSASKTLVKEGGTVIIAGACSEGMGHHELFAPDKALYRKPMPKRFLNDKELLVYSENISETEFFKIFWEGYRFYSEWRQVYQYIQKKYPHGARVLVFPYASLQLIS